MKLDYQILHILNNYKDHDGVSKYDYIKSTIWLRTWDLCYLLRNELNINIDPEVPFETTYEIALKAWKILEKEYSLIGIYGDKFLNNW